MKKTGLFMMFIMALCIGALVAGCSGSSKDTTEGGKYTFDKLCEKVSLEAETGVTEGLDNSSMTDEQKEIAKAAAKESTEQMKKDLAAGCEDMKKQIMSQISNEKKQKVAEGVYVKILMEECKDEKGMKYMTCLKTSEPKALEAANKAIN